MAQQQFERLVARAGLQQDEPVAAQQRLQGQEIFFEVVNQEEMYGLVERDHDFPTPRK